MFVFAIETNGKTVAFTKETDRIMLDGILNGEREEGQQLRKTLLFMKSKTVWDGVSPFTARLHGEAHHTSETRKSAGRKRKGRASQDA
jgi:hypothetical protein